MKQQRPGVKKAREEPTRERKRRYLPQVSIPWGRGGSSYRPGLFTKHYFEKHGEVCAADVYRSLSEEIERLNVERVQIEEKPIRRPNYSSFSRYFHWCLIMRLIRRTNKREPAAYDFLHNRVFYRLTSKGKSEVRAWEDLISVRHPEFR